MGEGRRDHRRSRRPGDRPRPADRELGRPRPPRGRAGCRLLRRLGKTLQVEQLAAHHQQVAAGKDRAGEQADLEDQIERYGLRKGLVTDLVTRQKRQVRTLRRQEIRFGLATLAGRYRDVLADAPDRADFAPRQPQRLTKVMRREVRERALAAVEGA